MFTNPNFWIFILFCSVCAVLFIWCITKIKNHDMVLDHVFDNPTNFLLKNPTHEKLIQCPGVTEKKMHCPECESHRVKLNSLSRKYNTDGISTQTIDGESCCLDCGHEGKNKSFPFKDVVLQLPSDGILKQ